MRPTSKLIPDALAVLPLRATVVDDDVCQHLEPSLLQLDDAPAALFSSAGLASTLAVGTLQQRQVNSAGSELQGRPQRLLPGRRQAAE